MLIFDGDATGFVTRPISGTILAFVVLVIALPVIRKVLSRRPATSADSHDSHDSHDSDNHEAGVR